MPGLPCSTRSITALLCATSLWLMASCNLLRDYPLPPDPSAAGEAMLTLESPLQVGFDGELPGPFALQVDHPGSWHLECEAPLICPSQRFTGARAVMLEIDPLIPADTVHTRTVRLLDEDDGELFTRAVHLGRFERAGVVVPYLSQIELDGDCAEYAAMPPIPLHLCCEDRAVSGTPMTQRVELEQATGLTGDGKLAADQGWELAPGETFSLPFSTSTSGMTWLEVKAWRETAESRAMIEVRVDGALWDRSIVSDNLPEGNTFQTGWQLAPGPHELTVTFAETVDMSPAPERASVLGVDWITIKQLPADQALAREVRLGWNEQGIHVCAEIEDQTLYGTIEERPEWLVYNDGLSLFLRPDLARLNKIAWEATIGDTLWKDDYQPTPRQALMLHGTPDDASADEGYTQEVTLEWGAQLAAPTPLEVWGAQLSLRDRTVADEESSLQKRWMETRTPKAGETPRHPDNYGVFVFAAP